MTKTTKEMFEHIIKTEGGFTDNSSDRGHRYRVALGDPYDSYCTNYGITQMTLSLYLDRQATVDEVKNLPKAKAIEIYEFQYFRRPRLNEIPQQLHLIAVDCAINHGPRRIIKWLQQICNEVSTTEIIVDGALGPKTLQKIEDVHSFLGNTTFNNYICDTREEFFNNLAFNDKSQQRFLKGWLKRSKAFRLPE